MTPLRGSIPPELPRRRRWGVIEWLAVATLVGLLVGTIWALWPSSAHAADENSKSVTGIPVEYLFGTIAALGSIVYADMKHAMRSLKHEAAKRGRHIRHVENAVRLICHKLNIPYAEDDDE